MRTRFGAAVGAALCVAAMATLHAAIHDIYYDAGTMAGQFSGVQLTTPDTYASCPTSRTSDVITTTGVGGRQLEGLVVVEYVTDSGRQLAPGGSYPVAQTGDLALQIFYPPVSDWPVQSDGTREIHVDISVELYEGGVKVATLGPGADWDLFCLDGPPPPPPPGGQGCTPGYWKQRHHYRSWQVYAPTHHFDVVFGAGPHITLAQALGTGGGGERALWRHATAALLNAASGGVGYSYSVAGVIALVREAYATGQFESVKNLFETQNESGCPLN